MCRRASTLASILGRLGECSRMTPEGRRLLCPPFRKRAGGVAVTSWRTGQTHVLVANAAEVPADCRLALAFTQHAPEVTDVCVVLVLRLRNVGNANRIPLSHYDSPQAAGSLTLPPHVVFAQFHCAHRAHRPMRSPGPAFTNVP
jgi:hypothetical protein